MNPAVLVGILLVVLVGGGLGAFFLLKGDDDKPANTNGGGDATATTTDTGGNGGGTSNVKWDTDQADALAHTAVLAVEDLPGRGWSVDSEDDFDDEPSTLGQGAACEALSSKGNDLDSAIRQLNAGRARRRFTNEPGGTAPVNLSAQSTVEIYDTSAKLTQYLNDFDKLLTDKDFPNCLATEMDPGFTGKKVNASQAAPSGGKAYAWDITGKSGGAQKNVRYEVYQWVLGNATVSMNIYGDQKDVKADVVKALLDKAVAKAKDTQSGKLKPNGGGATKSPSPSPSVQRSPSPSPSVRASPSPSPSVRPSPSPSPSPTPGGIRRDTFDNNNNGWPTGTYAAGGRASGTRSVVGGKLRYEVTASQPFLTWDRINFFHDGTQDLVLKVEARKLSGPGDASYGLSFHVGANNQNGYFFLVRDDGFVTISLFDGTQTTNIYSQGSDAAIARAGQAQVLELTMRGSTITFKVNGTQVGSVTDSKLKDGYQGVAVQLPTQGTAAVIEFDNWEVTGVTG